MRIRMNRRLFLGILSLAAVAALTLAPRPTLAGGSRELRLRVNLVSSGVDANAKGVAELRTSATVSDFKIAAQNLATGSYDILIAGVFQASLTVGTTGRGEVQFRTNPEPGENAVPLTFDPRGQLVQVAQGATTFLSVAFPNPPAPAATGITGVSGTKSTPIEILANLVATGALPGASGSTRFRSRNGRNNFRVEIEDVPDAVYGLRVAGADVATITVALGQGEVEFDTQPQQGKLPLTFDPRAQLVEVLSNGATILQVVFPQH